MNQALKILILFVLLTSSFQFSFPFFNNREKPNFKPSLKPVQNHRNVLGFVFPGAKSHHFIFKTLFDYTTETMREENPAITYNFTVIVHNVDKKLWDSSNYTIVGYGDVDTYQEKFHNAMENAKVDPVLGYNNFNLAMIHMYDEFLSDPKILEDLKKTKFDLILNDITNCLTVFLRKELEIKMSMYMNPTCVFTWLTDTFEYNAAYIPPIGSHHDHNMNFAARFFNQFLLITTRGMYKWFTYTQNIIFKNHGYDWFVLPFEQNALYLHQCVDGIHSPLSKPPNHISSGAILPRPGNKIETGSPLDLFLNKFTNNVYVSQGTISNALRVEQLADIFASFPDYGFILSLNKAFHISDLENLKNVFLTEWVAQNDLLGDPRVIGFITHGGINSLLESIYHAKPMIVIGLGIDQVNGAVMINTRQYGIGITSESELTVTKMIMNIKDLVNNKKYKENIKFASGIIKAKDGKLVFLYWLNYVMEFGYEHLMIPAYSYYSIFELYNVDLWLVLFGILSLVFWISWRILKSGVKRIIAKFSK